MRIDRSIVELSSALQDLGFGPLKPPKNRDVLEQIETAVAPLRIPTELRRFWETVDPYADGMQVLSDLSHPELIDLPMALEFWKECRGTTPHIHPAALLPIAYSSHITMAVELEDPRVPASGGALFEFDLVGDEFSLKYRVLSDWIEEMAAGVRAGKFELVEVHGLTYLQRRDWESVSRPRLRIRCTA